MSNIGPVTVWITPHWFWQDYYDRLPAWVQRIYDRQKETAE